MGVKKAVILSGGSGSRLGLFTRRVANKHAAIVYNRPMIEFPLSSFSQAGLKSLAMVTSAHQSGDMINIVGDGREFGFDDVSYFVQSSASGIAGALKLVENFVKDDLFSVILGDNIFGFDATDFLTSFSGGAKVILKEVHDPERFGVAEIDGDKIVSIEEKPKNPKSNYAITGFYCFDQIAFDIAKTLKPSHRGELEITDILEQYMKWGELSYEVCDGFWHDSGTPESLLRSSQWVQAHEDKLLQNGRFKNYYFDLGGGCYGDYLSKSVNLKEV